MSDPSVVAGHGRVAAARTHAGAVTAVRGKLPPHRRAGRVALGVVRYGVIALVAAAMFLPFFWMISASLMTYQESIRIPPVWWPEVPQWQHYAEVLRDPNVPLGLYFANSAIVSSAVTLLVLATSSLAGYALTKLHFPGRDAIFAFFLSTMMFPAFLFLVPVYYILKRLPLMGGNDWLGMGGVGALQSHMALILPFAVSAWGIFLMRQFMMSVPDELLDAARIDGASELGIWARIMLPLTRPALATVAIFTFIGQWNYLLWPLIVTTSAPHLMTVPVGIRMMATAYSTALSAGRLQAATAMAVVPTIVVFLAMQRHYIRGFALTGFK
ncbi:MAG: carbohydrate ABC transporter permease [Limnochordaceae bacterium]|nr:carbohydrate ABC transporter permease [Limnochordaceae bacterium]